MAKDINSILVPFAEVMWNKALNRARPTANYGTETEIKNLVSQLAKEGWWKGPNGLVEVSSIGDTWNVDGHPVPLSSFVDAEMAERQKKWDYLKMEANTQPAFASKLQIFEKMYTDGKGKLVKPKYFGVTGNRRGTYFFDAMCERVNLRAKLLASKDDGEKKLGETMTDDFRVPIREDDFSNQERRLDEQVKENVGKKQGNLDTSPVDMLLIGREMLSLGSSQAKLRQRFGDSIGVKIYHMCVIDRKYPKLQLIERCKAPADNPTRIPFQSVEYPRLQSMAQRFDQQSTDEYNKKLKAKGEDPKPVLTEEEVADYFSVGIKKEGGDDKDRMLDKNGVFNIAQVHANPFVQAAAKRIRKNDEPSTQELKKTEVFGPACTSLISLEADGDLPNAERILAKLVDLGKGKRRNQIEQQILALFGETNEPKSKTSDAKAHAKA